jgi:hypothetical protein
MKWIYISVVLVLGLLAVAYAEDFDGKNWETLFYLILTPVGYIISAETVSEIKMYTFIKVNAIRVSTEDTEEVEAMVSLVKVKMTS